MVNLEELMLTEEDGIDGKRMMMTMEKMKDVEISM